MPREEDCAFAAELFKKTGMSRKGHELRCAGCAVAESQRLQNRVDELERKMVKHRIAFSLARRALIMLSSGIKALTQAEELKTVHDAVLFTDRALEEWGE